MREHNSLSGAAGGGGGGESAFITSVDEALEGKQGYVGWWGNNAKGGGSSHCFLPFQPPMPKDKEPFMDVHGPGVFCMKGTLVSGTLNSLSERLTKPGWGAGSRRGQTVLPPPPT